MMPKLRTFSRRMESFLSTTRSTAAVQCCVMLALCGLLAGCQTTAGGVKGTADSGAVQCAFLPERPMPSWVSGLPETKDYVGVGQVGSSEGPEQQIRAAEDRARGSLAAGISVKIHEQLRQNICEGSCTAEEQSKILLKAESKTKHTLKGVEIKERWLDRGSCMVWVLATLSRDKVELRRAMMFNLSPPSIEMAGLLVGHLEKVLREDFAVVPADARLEGCATDSATPACQDRANTIFGAITVSLEKEPMDGQFRQRNFRVKGSLRFQDRLLSSFDVPCKARAEARAEVQTIDRAAAEDCRKKVQATMNKDLEMMD